MLDLPATMKVHPVFHVSLLHPYRQDGRVQPPPPPIEIDTSDLEYKVERILDHHDRKIGNRVKRKYLVSWVGYGPEHNSFEPETNLSNCQELIKEYWNRVVVRSAEGVGRYGLEARSRKHRTYALKWFSS
jgi:hypothetical protein